MTCAERPSSVAIGPQATPRALSSLSCSISSALHAPRVSFHNGKLNQFATRARHAPIRLAAPDDTLKRALGGDPELSSLLEKIQSEVRAFEAEELERLEAENAAKMASASALANAAPMLLPATIIASAAALRSQ